MDWQPKYLELQLSGKAQLGGMQSTNTQHQAQGPMSMPISSRSHMGRPEWIASQSTLCGVGLELFRERKGDVLKVAAVHPGSSAHSEGILPGNSVTCIDGLDSSLMSLEQAKSSLMGSPTTQVHSCVLCVCVRVSAYVRMPTCRAAVYVSYLQKDVGVMWAWRGCRSQSMCRQLHYRLATADSCWCAAKVSRSSRHPGTISTGKNGLFSVIAWFIHSPTRPHRRRAPNCCQPCLAGLDMPRTVSWSLEVYNASTTTRLLVSHPSSVLPLKVYVYTYMSNKFTRTYTLCML